MSDRRLWLEEACPSCHARVGLRCQTSRYGAKPSGVLHGARGWRHRWCPSCKAQPGELCWTPTGRQAGQPHTVRLSYGRELFADEDVWQELERWGATVALVRFSGGGGHPGSIAAVTLEDAEERELARWGHGQGELAEALAAPIWGRYALFRGHPRITGLLMWDVHERQVVVAGERGAQKFDEVLSAPRPPTRLAVIPAVPMTPRDTSSGPAAPADQQSSLPARDVGGVSCVCEHCGEPLPAGVRFEARYCSKRCRQAASRARLKLQPRKPPSPPPERCGWCGEPMPAGLRAEARFCSKRCRQASSRHFLNARRPAPDPSSPGDTSRALKQAERGRPERRR